MGLGDDDIARPMIGIASTWTGTMPCNLNQRDLAERVAAGVRAAGGTPLEFNTIAVSDNITMGTPGMRASLVSREVFCDSIELVARAHAFDGLVARSPPRRSRPYWPSMAPATEAAGALFEFAGAGHGGRLVDDRPQDPPAGAAQSRCQNLA